MTLDQLLQDVETLPHVARVQTMIELGRRSQTDAETAALLSEMAQGEWYQRFLALYSCFGSANASQVLAALTDPSRILRGLALRLLPLVCTPTRLQQALETVPPALRLPFLWKLASHKHFSLIDAFIEQLSPDEPQFCQMVCFASEATVLRFALLFQRKAQLADWSRLARFHPAATFEILAQWVNNRDQEKKPSEQYINKLLPLLVPARPERCLQLLTTLLRFIPLDELELQPLANRFPREITKLILAQKADIELSWNRLAPQLSDQQILDLCQKQRSMLNSKKEWFPLLSPEKRLFIYSNGRHFLLDYPSKMLPYTIITSLPRTQREEEGRSELRISEQKKQYMDLNYAAVLPWDEVLATLAPFLHSSDAERRTAALFAQIEAILYHREQLPMVLERLLQRRTEHDGVRKGILFALVGVPPVFWQKEHLAYLEEIIRHGLNDVGLSQETLRAIIKLLLRLLPYHFAWCEQQLQVVLRERGFVEPPPRSENNFGLRQIPQLHIEPALRKELLSLLLPILQAWAQQEKEAELLAMVEYLAPRGPLPEGVADLLSALLQQTQIAAIAERALRLLSRHQPRLFATTLLALLRNDASWITRPVVSAYLLRSRQDLLTPFLSNQTYSGRFSTGRKRFLPPLTHNATCLTASQQTSFASALLEQIYDPGQDSRTAAQIIKNLAFLPAIPATDLIQLARHQNSLLRTTALFTLGRLDGGDVVPELIAALQDSRARIAIVALRPLLLRMPPAQALAHLRAVPQTRVTVFKEKVRLMSDLVSEEAYRELLALEQQELHHDVRIALLETLWKHTQYAETWSIMERAIQDQDAEIAQAVVHALRFITNAHLNQRIEATGLTFHQHFLRLAALLLRHPSKDIHFDILWRYTRIYSQPLEEADSDHIVIPLLAQMVETAEKDEAEKAARQLFEFCSPQDSDLICQLFRLKLNKLSLLKEMVGSLNALSEEHFLPIIRAVLDVLATAPFTTLLRMQLAASHLPAEELYPFFADLAAKNELHAETLPEACKYIDRGLNHFDLPTLENTEKLFAVSEDECLRRLGLALLLEQVQRAKSWNADYRNRLHQYRVDRSPMVAIVAQFTFPEEED
jgi:hypothetical protein